MRLGVTGDTHGDLNFKRIFKARKLGYTHLIICGDFGYVWNDSKKENKQLDYLNKIGITILFCDGNHEGFTSLNSYPIVELYNGKVHKIRDNIFHLMRGEIYTINNKTFFVFGGANSTDREFRIERKTWWKEEKPSIQEYNYAISNLSKINNTVDYVISHTCYSKALSFVGGDYRIDDVSNILDKIRQNINFKYWYFGHMHIDYNILDLKTKCMYREIDEIK